ncbi:MAG: OmpA family protein [Ferruginibacter sp.]
MKRIVTIMLLTLIINGAQAQVFKKLKQKAADAVNKAGNKTTEGKKSDDADQSTPATTVSTTPATTTTTTPAIPAVVVNEVKPGSVLPDLKVYSRFDFVPGTTILYYDNFEKDNIGEAPAGWITSTSAEVVTIDGLEGNWLKLASTSSYHVVRNKKQSWGDNFTVEFDLLMVRKTYDPRITISLINSDGKAVTDERILQQTKLPVSFDAIVATGENQSRATLLGIDHRSISDNMTESLPYSNTTPVHIAMCVQGKRFRMWWNDRKLYDLPVISTDYIPNQLGFSFGNMGGSEFYVSNFRVAKDVPDTRARFEEGKLISNLLFYTGTAKLKPESMGALLDVSKVLKTATEPVKIIGHTDSDGDDAANLKLSEQRALTVRDILVLQYNIDETKLVTEGRGETQPLADNGTTEGKAQNRRVEFIFKPAADKYVKPAMSASPVKKAKTTKPGK